jgi:predicted nuclease of predicted toxin-antitoxin system
MGWTDISRVVANNPPPQKQIDEIFRHVSKRAKARFYADENFPAKAVSILRAMGAQVRTALEANLLGHPDENHLAYARRHGYMLLTRDRDFLDERRFPLILSPAIYVFDFGSGSDYEIRLAFRCLRTVLSMPQFFDKWWKYDAGRHGWTVSVRHLDGTTSRDRYRIWCGRLEIWT